MKHGGERTPKQAAQPLGVVRLVSFGAAALFAVLVLLGVAALRYPLTWTPDRTSASVVIVPEEARVPVVRPPPPERRREQERQEAEEAPPPAPPAPHAESSGPPPLITDPVWLQRPRDTARYYPRAAFVQGVEGRVVLDCLVEVSGRLACAVTSETPPGQGFGEAALAIADAHVMQPATQNGAPVRARYRMIVPFSTSQ